MLGEEISTKRDIHIYCNKQLNLIDSHDKFQQVVTIYQAL